MLNMLLELYEASKGWFLYLNVSTYSHKSNRNSILYMDTSENSPCSYSQKWQCMSMLYLKIAHALTHKCGNVYPCSTLHYYLYLPLTQYI